MTEYTEFTKMGIEKIQTTELLSSDDYLIMNDLSSELKHVFEKKQIFRTQTEMKYSVLNDIKFPSWAGKFWQAVREQNVMFTNLVYLSCDYEEKEGELDLLKLEYKKLGNTEIDTARKKITNAKIRKSEFELMDMRLTAKDRVRELRQWSEIKDHCKKMQKFNTNDVNADQLESYRLRWLNEKALGKMTGASDLEKAAIANLVTIENDTDRKNMIGSADR